MNLLTSIRNFLLVIIIASTVLCSEVLQGQHSVARDWNELLLTAIRNDLARPTVHARNLFHISAAMYDAWAVYDTVAKPYFLGNTFGDFTFVYDGIDFMPEDLEAARHEAISYAAYRLIIHRFANSPGASEIIPQVNAYFFSSGYDFMYFGTNYQGGNPADLGNYLAFRIINFGFQDGANEAEDYENQYYEPFNPPLVVDSVGNPGILDPNRWQPLTLDVFIDQSGNEIMTPGFLSPEWGKVMPFAMTDDDAVDYQRDGFSYRVYHDPGVPPYLDTLNGGAMSDEYIWGFSLVSAWSSHLDPNDTTTLDISPASLGNIDLDMYPTTLEGFHDFYDYENGGDISQGRDFNPYTSMPYEPNIVKRGDYARILAEFWADGPDSETPPGHWFTILNYVHDHPMFERRYRGEGEVIDELEWDIKAYFILGGAMHDAAVTAWGIKGYYDYIRPISAIRMMADFGQSTDTMGSNYHIAGLPLVEGLIDTVTNNDPIELLGPEGVNIGKVKVKAWLGVGEGFNPAVDVAGVDWILAENWNPYQRPSFVTPNFAGYISGHSTYSRAAAEVLTLMTGDEYFPGGMGEFYAPASQFLVFEDGPSEDITLQWATYRDASDQTSLSRIWGGIHPPADDIPGRLIGIEIGHDALNHAEKFFFIDEDQDGYFDFQDCDDNNANINPSIAETCDNIDNNCNQEIDEDLPQFTFYIDNDNDGFGSESTVLDTCGMIPPVGYVENSMDCNDNNEQIHPESPEICDNIDNNCEGNIDENLPLFTYYLDMDNDGFGVTSESVQQCSEIPPTNYVTQAGDCDDDNPNINPNAEEVCDGIDNNCNGVSEEGLDILVYFADADNDGFGNPDLPFETCSDEIPDGYIDNDDDCDDSNAEIHPSATEIPNNNIDEDCDGMDSTVSTIHLTQGNIDISPNPTDGLLYIKTHETSNVKIEIYDMLGALQMSYISSNSINVIDIHHLVNGVYLALVIDPVDGKQQSLQIVKK